MSPKLPLYLVYRVNQLILKLSSHGSRSEKIAQFLEVKQILFFFPIPAFAHRLTSPAKSLLSLLNAAFCSSLHVKELRAFLCFTLRLQKEREAVQPSPEPAPSNNHKHTSAYTQTFRHTCLVTDMCTRKAT